MHKNNWYEYMRTYTLLWIIINAEAAVDYPDSDQDLMICLDSLANYYVDLGKNAKSKDVTRECFGKVYI